MTNDNLQKGCEDAWFLYRRDIWAGDKCSEVDTTRETAESVQ